MKRVDFGKCFLTLMILVVSCWPAAAGSLKTTALNQKIHDISMLRVKIIDKIDQAVEMRYQLEQRLIELRGEIRAEQQSAGIYTHPEALQNSHIRYNLSLIQILQAYISLLNERIDYFHTGNERLKYLNDQINDDLAIINILNDMEIETLIDRINLVLDEFIPEMQKQVFNAAHIRLLSIEYVWDAVRINPN